MKLCESSEPLRFRAWPTAFSAKGTRPRLASSRATLVFLRLRELASIREGEPQTSCLFLRPATTTSRNLEVIPGHCSPSAATTLLNPLLVVLSFSVIIHFEPIVSDLTLDEYTRPPCTCAGQAWVCSATPARAFTLLAASCWLSHQNITLASADQTRNNVAGGDGPLSCPSAPRTRLRHNVPLRQAHF